MDGLYLVGGFWREIVDKKDFGRASSIHEL